MIIVFNLNLEYVFIHSMATSFIYKHRIFIIIENVSMQIQTDDCTTFGDKFLEK